MHFDIREVSIMQKVQKVQRVKIKYIQYYNNLNMGKGRGNSKALSVNEVLRLEITQIVKEKLIRFGKPITYKSSWTSGASIQVTTIYNKVEKLIRLKYEYKNKLIEYDIKIAEVKSNLGKGVILYFICPETSKRCKILYCCYDSEIFKSRGAYSQRIYYFNQFISKTFLTPTRYDQVDKLINLMYDKRKTRLYKGKETKRHLRLLRLLEKRAYLDKLKSDEFMKWFERRYAWNG